jgi:hypothetical protein
MLARVQTALYRDDPEAAWHLMQQHEAPLRSSMLTRAQALRVESNYLRGRSALALAARRSDRRLLAVSRNCARRIAGERMHWSTPLGLLLSAGIASAEGDVAQAQRHLTAAVGGLDRAEMQWYAAVARRWLGELRAGDEGQPLRDTAAT